DSVHRVPGAVPGVADRQRRLRAPARPGLGRGRAAPLAPRPSPLARSEVKGVTMIPTTTKRVILNTNRRVNDSICEKTRERVAHYASATPQMLEQRLCELDHEWDVERITATCVALGTLGGVLLVSLFGVGWL